MKRQCSMHGMVEVVADGTCAVCGGPTLDPDNPVERAEIDRTRSARRKNALLEVVVGLVAVVVALGPLVASAYTRDPDIIAFIPIAALLAVFVVALVARARHHEPAPGARLRFWTSASMVSAIVCIAFVGIKRAVGIDALAFSRDHLAEPWLVVTSAFTHGGAAHIAGNMIALAMFGPVIDLRVGRARTALVLAAAAFAGAYAQALLSPEPMVGFSGAIYGLFGATLALVPNRPQVLTLNVIQIPMPTWAWMIVCVPLFTVIGMTDTSQHVAWAAHLGGFFAGLLVALPMRRVPESADFIAVEKAREAHVAALARQSLAADVADFGAAPATADAATRGPDDADPAMRAFHHAHLRRQITATAVGGALMALFGLAAAALGTWIKAPAMAEGRRYGVIGAGLVMTVAGAAMIRQAIKLVPRR